MFDPSLPHGKVVTFVQRTVTSTDSYGNDVYGETTVDVPGCAINPGSSSESFQGTLQITSDVVAYVPSATVVDMPMDIMVIDDVRYNVIGSPRTWGSPWTGTGSFLEVAGKLVTTGGDAT
jgi:hypothetical protein